MSIELPSVNPEAYKNRSLYPTPTQEQNIEWAGVIQAARNKNKEKSTDLTSAECGINAHDSSATDELRDFSATAINSMWEANLRLVDFFITEPANDTVRPARRNVVRNRKHIEGLLEQNPQIELDDVRQWARLALRDAIITYEPEKGAFGTYALLLIRQKVWQGFADEARTIRIKSRSMYFNSSNELRNTHVISVASNSEHGFSDEIAEVNERPDYIATCTVPLDYKPDTDGIGYDTYIERKLPEADMPLAPVNDKADVKAEEAYDQVEQRSVIKDSLFASLTEKERSVIFMYYGLNSGIPMTFETISKCYGVTKQRIHQLHDKALKKLHNALNLPESQDEPKRWTPIIDQAKFDDWANEVRLRLPKAPELPSPIKDKDKFNQWVSVVNEQKISENKNTALPDQNELENNKYYKIGKFVTDNGFMILDPKTGLKIDPQDLQ